MDSFWGPLIIYAVIFVVGLVIGGIGAGIAENKRNEHIGHGIAAVGFSILAVGASAVVIHLIGNCIEKCF